MKAIYRSMSATYPGLVASPEFLLLEIWVKYCTRKNGKFQDAKNRIGFRTKCTSMSNISQERPWTELHFQHVFMFVSGFKQEL